MLEDSGIVVLVRFARLAAEAKTGGAILPLLDDALATNAGADAVAIVEIEETTGAARVVPTAHAPAELLALTLDPDALGAELGARLKKSCNATFESVRALPLVSGGGLFGSVVLFSAHPPSAERRALAQGLVDLAAVALGSAAQIARLARSHAELRAAQETLVRSEKLRALGQMAAGVSHDLKNVLSPISLHLQLIERSLARGNVAEAKESIPEMRQILKRGLELLEQLRDYSRQQPESRSQPVDLNALVKEARAIATPRMTSRKGATNLFVEQLGEPALVMGRSAEIVSALVNLIVNAIDASPDGGTINLKSGSSEAGVWVAVADGGSGMTVEVQKHVFDPFFTTKGEDGTGLGLAMVFACMQRHGGRVSLESEVGHGSTFTLLFPPVP